MINWKRLKFPRRQYLRPKPPARTEKLIGAGILVLVGVIGVSIYQSGRRYDANLFRLDPKLLNKLAGDTKEPAKRASRSTSIDGEPTVTANVSATPTTSTSSVPTTPTNSATPAAGADPTNSSDSAQYIPAQIPGWTRKGQIDRFGPDNLYDKVDGRENLYKTYKFHELLAADFVPAEGSRFIQVELFDMTDGESAQGVFGAERPSHPNTTKIGTDAYIDTNGAFFWQDRFYVRVIGSDSDATTQKAAIELAQTIANKIPKGKPPVVVDPLPKEGRVPDSLKFIAEGAFSQSFLRKVYSARYKVDGQELTAFVMINDDAAKANDIVEQYRKAMSSFGKFQAVTEGSITIYYIEAYGSQYAIFARDKFVGGVMEADKQEPALKLAKKLVNSLGQTKPK